MEKPEVKPNHPFFSSGPCSKRPGWNLEALNNAFLGRSHRAKNGKAKLNEVIVKSKELLELPDDYLVGIVPASDTGAIEMAMWSLLGQRGVDVCGWESFGLTWVKDITKQLKLNDVTIHDIKDYGELPDLSKVNFDNDVVFTWNGTTSGVCVPNADWIPNDRKGLAICDATSAVFAMDMDFTKLDVVTWSWQKVLGGEAAHGMIALSPRAVERLENHQPTWPVPKVFRMASKKKFISGIFEGSTINTPSMLCVEDAIDVLNWAEDIGGLEALIKRSEESFSNIDSWINETSWVEFLSKDPDLRSNTSITFKIIESWFLEKDEKQQKEIMKEIISLLMKEKVAFDINSYAKAPPSFRVWGGSTVEPDNIKKLLPWIDWAYHQVRSNYV